jgi:hypothetical protein
MIEGMSSVDFNYTETIGIELREGIFFSEEYTTE